MNTKLTVELVPATAWNKNLRSELSKKLWDKLRTECYAKAGYCCEVCGGKGRKHPVECHEIWHYDDEKKTQTLKGLIALCPSCHEVKHMGYARIKGREKQAKQHLAKVNGWTETDVEYYLDFVFEQYAQRSRFDWTLDITWATKKEDEEEWLPS